jgi:hypothetical protein
MKGHKTKGKKLGVSVLLFIQNIFVFVIGFVFFLALGPKGESLQLTNKNRM